MKKQLLTTLAGVSLLFGTAGIAKSAEQICFLEGMVENMVKDVIIRAVDRIGTELTKPKPAEQPKQYEYNPEPSYTSSTTDYSIEEEIEEEFEEI